MISTRKISTEVRLFARTPISRILRRFWGNRFCSTTASAILVSTSPTIPLLSDEALLNFPSDFAPLPHDVFVVSVFMLS